MTTVTVAAIQAGSVLFDKAATLAKAERLIGEAASQGVDLAVLPEAFFGGYPKGLEFGISVGSRSSEGRQEFRRYWQSAIEVPGPETERLGEISAEKGLHLVVGAIERGAGTLYCSALFFTPEDGLVATHRKLMPTAAERYLWGQGDGSTMPVVDADFGTLGAAICWENYMPLFRQTMYSKGVDIWCAPTVDDRDAWHSTMTHVALEGRCFVISANQFLTRRDLPKDVHPVQGDDPETVLINGGSVIVSPLGEILAGPLREREGVLVAELDMNEIPESKFDFDSVGHYARPDVFTLLVDESSKTSVQTLHSRTVNE